VAKPKRLPLRDPRWVPIQKIIRELRRAIGADGLVAYDLRQALLAGRLRAKRRLLMRRRIAEYASIVSVGPASHAGAPTTIQSRQTFPDVLPRHVEEPVPREFWQDVTIRVTAERLEIIWNTAHRSPRVAVPQFYLWQPDVMKIWPAITPGEKDNQAPSPRNAGRPRVYEWHAIDGEIARRCIDPKTGRLRVPANERKLSRDVLEWCGDKIAREPTESEMRKAVKAVCAALRSAQK
jgi:hypothetical protein